MNDEASIAWVESFEACGILRNGVERLFMRAGRMDTLAHSVAVAEKAVAIADACGLDRDALETAALLHDASAVIPSRAMVSAAERWSLAMVEEERRLPMLLHQRLSAAIARRTFGVSKPEIISAIACHTTLKASASDFDMALFLADKLSWDRKGAPPFAEKVEEGMLRSLASGCVAYIEWLFGEPGALLVAHPDLVAARAWLASAPR
jgi:predicted HD superfamily hydrolase involved in NAD metabolism